MCFAAVCLGTLADDMLRLLEIRITAIWTWGHKVVADRLMPARVRKKSEILAELRRLVTDKTLTDEAFRAKANTLLLADQPSTLRSRAADVREILSRNARRIRPILQLLTKLDLRGDGYQLEKDLPNAGAYIYRQSRGGTTRVAIGPSGGVGTWNDVGGRTHFLGDPGAL
jgi:hypothetical protein